MKQFKLTSLLTVFMSMACLQSFADFDTSTKVEKDGLYYYLDKDNTQAQLTFAPGYYTGDIEIPSDFTYDGQPYSVTSIGDNAFFYCSGLTSVNIPNSVKSIGENAFYGCSALTSITISNGVTCIGKYAFFGCTGLTSVNIPNCVKSIGNRAFSRCFNLVSMTVESGNATYDSRDNCNAIIETGSNTLIIGCMNTVIPNSVALIGEYAFYECSGLTSINIPSGVTSIGEYAFQECTSITSVTIPSSVTSIGSYAFSRCSGLASMTVESGNATYDSRDNCNAIIETASNTLIASCKNTIIPNSVKSIGDYAFYECFGLTDITIPNSVTSIGNSAFFNCKELTSVTIPNSVTSVGDSAFGFCYSLVSVTVLNTTPVAITQNVFSNRTNTTLYVPVGSKDAYQAADYWKEFKEIIEIDPTGIEQISVQGNGYGNIDQEGATWYTIDGKRASEPQRGLNIIRMSNGTTKKIVVK